VPASHFTLLARTARQIQLHQGRSRTSHLALPNNYTAPPQILLDHRQAFSDFIQASDIHHKQFKAEPSVARAAEDREAALGRADTFFLVTTSPTAQHAAVVLPGHGGYSVLKISGTRVGERGRELANDLLLKWGAAQGPGPQGTPHAVLQEVLAKGAEWLAAQPSPDSGAPAAGAGPSAAGGRGRTSHAARPRPAVRREPRSQAGDEQDTSSDGEATEGTGNDRKRARRAAKEQPKAAAEAPAAREAAGQRAPGLHHQRTAQQRPLVPPLLVPQPPPGTPQQHRSPPAELVRLCNSQINLLLKSCGP
jgi:hypothetical protein